MHLDYNRYNTEYRKARQEAIKRDGGKCKFPGCKEKYRKVQTHHIIKYADSPHLMWNVNNLICLCWVHHRKIWGKEEYYIELFSNILANDRQNRHS